MSINTEFVYLVRDVEDPAEVWKILNERFDSKSMGHVLNLNRRLFSLKMKTGITVRKHIRSFKEMIDSSSAVNARVEESQQIAVLLNSVSDTLSPAATVMSAREDKDLAMSLVRSTILAEEEQIEQKKLRTTNSPDYVEALRVQNDTRRKRWVRCYNCGKLGHIARNCRKPSVESYTKPAPRISYESKMHLLIVNCGIKGSNKWYIDLGATKHMTYERNANHSLNFFDEAENVYLGDGRKVSAIGQGTVIMGVKNPENTTLSIQLQNVLYVPNICCNLLSVHAINIKGYSVLFHHVRCTISDKDGRSIAHIELDSRCHDCDYSELKLWHQRLGHLNEDQLCRTISCYDRRILRNVKCSLPFCPICAMDKLHNAPHKPLNEIRSSQKLQFIHSDICGPMSEHSEMKDFLDKEGIQFQNSAPYTPQQNGVVERMNRTLIEAARDIYSYFYKKSCANKFIKLAITPYEMFFAFALIPQHRRTKFQKKANSVIFIGYGNNAHAYKLLDPLTKCIYLRADVRFDENSFPGLSSRSSTQYNIQNQTYDLSKNAKTILVTECIDSAESPQKLDASINQQDYEPADDIRSNKGIPPKRYDQNMMIIADHEINNEWYDVHNEPSSIHEALNCNDRNEWKKAIDSEIGALKENNTWELVDRPEEKYKARLVAKGCAQIYDVDYFETYSPVVKLTTIRILIAVAVERNMLLHQMGISNTFLNGKSKEDIFMEQPEVFIINPNKVCKLNRSIYGLKQSPRCWNNTLTEYLKNNGFAESNSDPCLFIRNDNKFMIIAVYVNNLIIASKNQDELLNYCLGIEINIHEDNIELQQTKFIQRMLNKYHMAECKIVSTPMNPNIRLEVNDNTSKSIDQKLYQYIIGSLLYKAICTRPDKAYAVGILSRFNISSNESHLTAAKQVMRYLR
ncbi:hypothetical protein GJ496_003169 [Pomphorhynchus laevis]|nr:hypothetical protein GJ496_003169 [Pomphorhynchus laevis]